MKRKDLVLALAVVMGWGTNFTFMKLGLDGIPSMLMVAMRYLFVMVPAIFFVKKPNISFKYIILYGLTVGVGQFACMFYAIEIGMPAGLASVIMQLQAFITPALAAIFLREKLNFRQLTGFAIAFIGLITIGFASVTGDIISVPLKAFLITICAPVFWSISNIISRIASDELVDMGEEPDTFGMVVWSSIVPPIPMFVLSLIFHRPSVVIDSIRNLNLVSVFSVLFLAYIATLFCYGAWNYLIFKYPLSVISPTSLLVPVFGLLVSRVVLSEQLSLMQWIGVSFLLLGLIVTNLNLKRFFHYGSLPMDSCEENNPENH